MDSLDLRPRTGSVRPRIGTLLMPTDPYWIQVLESIIHAAQDFGGDLVVLQPATSNQDFESIPSAERVDYVLAQGLDALIWATGNFPILRSLLAANLPIVCLDECELTSPLLTVA